MTNDDTDKKTIELHKVYESQSAQNTSKIYDNWSDEYEQHMQGVGYTHPAIVASMLSRHLPPSDSPVLDAGSGTGILGEILSALGYSNLHGFDASKGMINYAKTKGIYQSLQTAVLGEELDYESNQFAASVASGVFTQGHAPLAGLNELIRITRPNGFIVFTISRTFLGETFAAFETKLANQGKWRRIDVSNMYDSAPLAKEKLLSQAFAFCVA